jgi:hypothetical protein
MNIEFYTDDEVAAKHFPPLPSSRVLPEWFREMPRYITPPNEVTAQSLSLSNNVIRQTVKGCLPFLDYITSGYVIRAAADIAITPAPNGDIKGWWWASSGPHVGGHPHTQCPVKMNNKNNEYIKLISSWRVKTPKGYSALFYQPEFMLRDEVRLFPGVVDTDVYDQPVNFPGILVADSTVVIKAGDPLMVVFPFARHEWTHTVSVSSTPENLTTRFFERGYQKFFHKQKSYV